jgi:uncharacterized protein (TIGR02996 family)
MTGDGRMELMVDTATETAFLRTILASPEDDAPRLVYADWLDENGDPDRAEFIRLQVRLARTDLHDPEWPRLKAVVSQIEQAHHVSWVNQLPELSGVHWEIFERGFISAVRADDPDAFFRSARKIFAAAPIREVRLHQFSWHKAKALAESPYLTRVRVLDLNDGNRIGNLGVEALMRSPQLRNLAELKVGRNSLGSAAIRSIAESPYVRGLRGLKAERNDLYDDGLKHLAGSPALREITYLDLERTRTGDDGLMALARSKHVTHLTWLHLGGNLITDAGIEALAASHAVAEVRDLFLHSNQLTDRAIVALADSPHLGKLERLFLRQNRIGDKGAMALAGSPHLGRLEHLYVGDNLINDLAADALRRRFPLVNLY